MKRKKSNRRKPTVPSARYVRLDKLMETVISRYLSPMPCSLTIRGMLDESGIPRLRVSRSRGKGAPVFYDREAVEKHLKSLATT